MILIERSEKKKNAVLGVERKIADKRTVKKAFRSYKQKLSQRHPLIGIAQTGV